MLLKHEICLWTLAWKTLILSSVNRLTTKMYFSLPKLVCMTFWILTLVKLLLWNPICESSKNEMLCDFCYAKKPPIVITNVQKRDAKYNQKCPCNFIILRYLESTAVYLYFAESPKPINCSVLCYIKPEFSHYFGNYFNSTNKYHNTEKSYL